MGNLLVHEVAGGCRAIEAVGAHLLYLPSYSPDFDPIEIAFSRLEARLGRAAAQTVDDLWDAIGQAIDAFTPHECRNFLTTAGCDRNYIEPALGV